MAEETRDEVRSGGEDGLSVAPLDDEDGEDNLESETPEDGLPFDGAAIGGESVGESEESDES